ADRVTVLRDGRNAGELARDEVSHDALVRLMVGRDLKQLYPRTHKAGAPGPVRLAVRGLTFEGGPHPVSFELRGGEGAGRAGAGGAGGPELAEALFGIRRVTGGSVLLDGRPVVVRHPSEAVEAGLLLVPEDRRLHGLVLGFSIRENLALPNYEQLSVAGWVVGARVARLCRELMERLRVRAYGPSQPAGLLSGGNQQQVAVGKWLDEPPRRL